MGDRAHAVVKSGDSEVYLYTHWDGTELPETVRDALKRAKDAGRLHDAPYLTRIIFCEMIKGEEQDSALGFGIHGKACEDESRDVIVNVDNQTVTTSEDGATVPLAQFIQ
jgi:hypothetical protein